MLLIIYPKALLLATLRWKPFLRRTGDHKYNLYHSPFSPLTSNQLIVCSKDRQTTSFKTVTSCKISVRFGIER